MSDLALTTPRRIAALVPVVLALVLTAESSAVADPRADQEQIDRKVAEAAATLEHATERAQEAAARYAAASAALPAAEARADEARGQIAAARARVDSAEREAESAESVLVTAGDQVEESAAAVEQAREEAAAFAIAAYKGSRLASFRLMLRADGPAEAVERLGYIDHIAGVERVARDELTTARLRARQAENDATLAFKRAESARLASAAALAQVEAAAAEAEEAAAEANALAQAGAAALRVAEDEEEESLRRYEAAEAASARITTEVRAWESTQPPPATGGHAGGKLLMPAQGWQSSPYGMRHDPVYGVWRLHAGMDIAAAGGTPIYAAADGKVIQAGWSGGYGNYTCLGHGTHQGQGLSTCYAHQSEILVTTGQSVSRGDLIGRIGSTGASTGDHLHFEVRLDGSPTDPVPFLPACLC